MGGLGLNMRVKVKRGRLITTLENNRARHLELYREARIGFVEKAEAELLKRLELITSGLVTDVFVHVQAPECMADAYTTAIEMFSWCVDEEVELSAAEFRMLVQDQWEWTSAWVTSNSGYSKAIAALGQE